jgi:hypothetical protein
MHQHGITEEMLSPPSLRQVMHDNVGVPYQWGGNPTVKINIQFTQEDIDRMFNEFFGGAQNGTVNPGVQQVNINWKI